MEVINMRNKLKIWYYFKFKKVIRSIKYDLFDEDGELRVLIYILSPCLYYGISGFNLSYILGLNDLLDYIDANEEFFDDDKDIKALREYRDNYMYKYLTQKCQRYL